LGSKGKKGIKPSSKFELTKTKKSNKNELKNEESSQKSDNDDNADVKSVATRDMSSLTLTSLKPINNYKLEELKKVAHILTIPVFSKDGKNRHQLRKDELYDKIKICLIERDDENKKSD
jgi:hypothetical protein